jgi:predicted transcriptional regulator
MFEKFFIVQDIAKTLAKNDYKISFCTGCFDIAASREEKFLLKVLVNIDSFSKIHSLSLKAISYFLSAIPLII